MKWVVSAVSAGLFVTLFVNTVSAEEQWHPRTPLPPLAANAGPCCPPPVQPGCPAPGTPGTPGTLGTPGEAAAQPGQTEPTGATPSPEAGSLAANTFDPSVFGDLIGPIGTRIVTPTSVTKPGTPKLSGSNRVAIIAPVPYRGTFKITENESPRPTDRVFFSYNFFDNVSKNFVLLPSNGQANLNRETIGFEKTFLDGNASVGLRLPFFELTGNSTVEDNLVGDLSILFKYALINNRDTNNVLSTGMVLTVPTGQGVAIEDESDLHSTIFEPFIGYIFHLSPDLYLEGFSSVSVPTDIRDVTLLFNSIAAGYWLYRSNDKQSLLTGLVPDLEIHVNTPLNHRGLDSSGPIGYQDTVDMTVGCYFIFHRATAGMAFCVPLTGPKPYDFEATASLNFRF